jgi:hypothetical protein
MTHQPVYRSSKGFELPFDCYVGAGAAVFGVAKKGSGTKKRLSLNALNPAGYSEKFNVSKLWLIIFLLKFQFHPLGESFYLGSHLLLKLKSRKSLEI